MKDYSEPRIAFELAASRQAAAAIAAACFATLAVIAATPLAFGWRAAALAWSGHAAIAALRRIAWHRGRGGVRAARIAGGIAIEVEDGEGGRREGEVRAGSFVAPWLTVIRWQPGGARFTRSIVILPDMLDGERFRALRVVLRWSPPPR